MQISLYKVYEPPICHAVLSHINLYSTTLAKVYQHHAWNIINVFDIISMYLCLQMLD